MNKTARSHGLVKPEPRLYYIEYFGEEETAVFHATHGVLVSNVLMLHGAAPDGETLSLPVFQIRSWWSEPATQQSGEKHGPVGAT